MKQTVTIIISLLLCLAFAFSASAESSYIYDVWGKSVASPHAYECTSVYTGEAMGTTALSAPADIFVEPKSGDIYIADSGNNRIVVVDEGMKLSRIISKVTGVETDTLSAPQGVFAKNGIVYICDTGNNRVIAVDSSNTVTRLIERPKSDLLSDHLDFKPTKVIVNNSEQVYVLATGIYQGLVLYNEENEFQRFFAPNTVEVDLLVQFNQLWKSIFTDAQKEGLTRNLPNEYTNVFFSPDGFIYTATATVEDKQIRRINAAGNDTLNDDNVTNYDKSSYGDIESVTVNDAESHSAISDVHVDKQGIIAALDSERGRVFLYTQESDLIAVFGNNGKVKGTFSRASAIEKSGDDYLILDTEKATVTVYSQTDYFSLVRQALESYKAGEYDASAKLLEKVLDENTNFAMGYRLLGRISIMQGDYETALELLKQGNDKYYYSLALKENRRQFFNENIAVIMVSAVLVIGAAYGVSFIIRRRKGAGKK